MSSTAGHAAPPDRDSRRRRDLVLPWAALAGVGVAWLAVAASGPSDTGFVVCPWRFLTGLDCPFCGSTRAAASLAHGDLVGALDHNALFVMGLLPLAAVAWGLWVSRSRTGRPMPAMSDRALTVGLLIVGAWWLARLAIPWLGSGSAV